MAFWTVLGDGLALLGSLFVLVGGVGILRLPDFFTRLHAAGLTDTLGTVLVALGLILGADSGHQALKVGLIVAFLLITTPTATHALAKAAIHGGLRPSQRARTDQGDEPSSPG